MNKLNTNLNGGFPLVLDDLRFMDASYREALSGLVSSFVSGFDYAVILSGCDYSDDGTSYTVTAGYLMLGDEIVYLPLSTGAIVPMTPFLLSLDVGYDVDGDKVSLTGNNSIQAYEVRRARVYYSNVVLGATPVFNLIKTIHQIIAEKQQHYRPRWVTQVLQASQVKGTITDYAITLNSDTTKKLIKYRIDGKTVTIDFNIHNCTIVNNGVSDSVAGIVIRLPLGIKCTASYVSTGVFRNFSPVGSVSAKRENITKIATNTSTVFSSAGDSLLISSIPDNWEVLGSGGATNNISLSGQMIFEMD